MLGWEKNSGISGLAMVQEREPPPSEETSPSDQYVHQAEKYSDLTQREWKHVVEIPSVMQALGSVQGLTCLDVGCGSGLYTRTLKAAGAEHVMGIDLSSQMIQIARQQETQGIVYLVHDCERLDELDLPKEHFDIVFGGWIIPYIPSPQRIVRFAQNVRSLLKKGGRTIQVFGHEDRIRTGHLTEHLTGSTVESESADLRDGESYKVIIRAIGSDCKHGAEVRLVNRYYRHQTVARCFQKAGFAATQYHSLALEADCAAQKERYQLLLEYPFFAVFEAINM